MHHRHVRQHVPARVHDLQVWAKVAARCRPFTSAHRLPSREQHCAVQSVLDGVVAGADLPFWYGIPLERERIVLVPGFGYHQGGTAPVGTADCGSWSGSRLRDRQGRFSAMEPQSESSRNRPTAGEESPSGAVPEAVPTRE